MYLRQLAGPPRYNLPWYTEPPFQGKVACSGCAANTLLGPVLAVKHTQYISDKYLGYVSC